MISKPGGFPPACLSPPAEAEEGNYPQYHNCCNNNRDDTDEVKGVGCCGVDCLLRGVEGPCCNQRG